MKISVCIITLNEEANLARALSSVQHIADEIVVVDSGSVDATKSIAERFNARWIEQEWLGYVGQKNLALASAQHEWIFSLDADEELSAELRNEIQALKATGAPSRVGGYSISRVVQYEGKWIRHGDWYPDRLVRLFRRAGAKFAGGKVHERLEMPGEVVSLRGELYHYSFRDAIDHWERCQKYARLWAESQREQGRRVSALAPLAHGFFRFLRAYILRLGFLDGRLGFRIARYAAAEAYLKYKLLRQE
ncbi:MAG TPA: glycosyltransferase family 2 protein [Methylomirabilota bacterium]|nr:glycosyltransferase family 2 protein [Methylomirabilota bacterium]